MVGLIFQTWRLISDGGSFQGCSRSILGRYGSSTRALWLWLWPGCGSGYGPVVALLPGRCGSGCGPVVALVVAGCGSGCGPVVALVVARLWLWLWPGCGSSTRVVARLWLWLWPGCGSSTRPLWLWLWPGCGNFHLQVSIDCYSDTCGHNPLMELSPKMLVRFQGCLGPQLELLADFKATHSIARHSVISANAFEVVSRTMNIFQNF